MSGKVSSDRNHRKRLILWGCVGLLIMGFWAFTSYSRGGVVPWFWLGLGGVLGVLFALDWIATKPLDPKLEEALAEILREWATCRWCKSALEPQAVICGSCKKVVDWGPIVGIGLALLFLVSIVVRIVYVSEA
jgi:hypothetical protein